MMYRTDRENGWSLFAMDRNELFMMFVHLTNASLYYRQSGSEDLCKTVDGLAAMYARAIEDMTGKTIEDIYAEVSKQVKPDSHETIH